METPTRAHCRHQSSLSDGRNYRPCCTPYLGILVTDRPPFPALSFDFFGFVASRDVLIQRVANICLCLSPPPSLLSSSTQTMFRGIIPGKRVASVDLTAERNGASKENVECSAAPARSTRKPSVFQDVNGNKTQKPITTKKQSGVDSEEMVEAFDKLLVSSLLACLLITLIII